MGLGSICVPPRANEERACPQQSLGGLAVPEHPGPARCAAARLTERAPPPRRPAAPAALTEAAPAERAVAAVQDRAELAQQRWRQVEEQSVRRERPAGPTAPRRPRRPGHGCAAGA